MLCPTYQSPQCAGISHLLPISSSTHPTASTMSSSTAISPISNFQLIFSTALKTYERRTKTNILIHPLASQLQACNSPASIIDVLQGQVHDLDQARKKDERLTKWLNPTINVLLAFSATVGEGVSLVSLKVIFPWNYPLTKNIQVFSPATVIFAGAGVLLQVCIFLDTFSLLSLTRHSSGGKGC